jgi:hypothetical protein
MVRRGGLSGMGACGQGARAAGWEQGAGRAGRSRKGMHTPGISRAKGQRRGVEAPPHGMRVGAPLRMAGGLGFCRGLAACAARSSPGSLTSGSESWGPAPWLRARSDMMAWTMACAKPHQARGRGIQVADSKRLICGRRAAGCEPRGAAGR